MAKRLALLSVAVLVSSTASNCTDHTTPALVATEAGRSAGASGKTASSPPQAIAEAGRSGSEAGKGGGGAGGRATPATPVDAGPAAPPSDAAISDAGPAADGGTCGVESVGPGTYWKLTGDWPRDAQRVQRYQGWVTVERSTTRDLVLYARPNAAGDDAGPGDDAGAAHCVIDSPSDLPVIAIGSRLWLDVLADRDFGGFPRVHQGDRLSLRASPKGALLLATLEAKVESDGTLNSEALSFTEAKEECSKPDRNCLADGVTTSYSLQIEADSPRRIREGAHETVQLGGAPYDVWLRGARVTRGTMVQCADYVNHGRIWVGAELRALETAPIIEKLARAEVPECRLGNDAGGGSSHSITGHSISEVHEREVKYRGIEDGRLIFDLVDDPEHGWLYFSERADFPEPAPGKTFWLSAEYWFFVLREAKSGPILLSSGMITHSDFGSTGFVAKDLGRIGSWWGTSVAFESACVYETVPNVSGGRDEIPLYRMRVGANPGTQIPAGTRARVNIGGDDYELWFSSAGEYLSFLLTPAK